MESKLESNNGRDMEIFQNPGRKYESPMKEDEEAHMTRTEEEHKEKYRH